MIKTDFPVKKTFSQDFITKDNKTLFTIKYEQATLWEYYEFILKTPTEQTLEIYNIFRSQIPLTWKDKIFLYFNKNYVTDFEQKVDLESVVWSIMANRFRGHKSIFSEVKKRKLKPSENKVKLKGSIDQSGHKSVCSTFNIPHKDLLEYYTLEQYLWFLDGVEWDNNTMTDEGIAINNEAIKDVDAIKERAKKIRESLWHI